MIRDNGSRGIQAGDWRNYRGYLRHRDSKLSGFRRVSNLLTDGRFELPTCNLASLLIEAEHILSLKRRSSSFVHAAFTSTAMLNSADYTAIKLLLKIGYSKLAIARVTIHNLV